MRLLPLASVPLLLPVFITSIFLSAGLLFLVQPLAGKILLPLLGGSPAVWNTCMVFFQGVLLLGYGYSHFVTKLLRPRTQATVHTGLLLLAALTLPIPIQVGQPPEGSTISWLLTTLALTVGLPFFVVSTTGPLLQRWFSLTDHKQAGDPYFLYAASNAGSIIGLLSYPAFLEPFFTRAQQSWVYTIGFYILAPLVIACAALAIRHRRAQPDAPQLAATPLPTSPPDISQSPTTRTRLYWLILAFTPSTLMLGVTQYLTTDVAPVPLLWIVPLLLYLLTFIIAFSPAVRLSAAAYGRLLPIPLTAVLVALLLAASNPMSVLAFIHLSFFFVATLMCHKRLSETRPDPSRLTEFYFIMSLGGVLGGIFNALLSPVLFNTLTEYPIAIALACLLRPQIISELGSLTTKRKLVTSLVLSFAVAFLLLVYTLNADAFIGAGRFNNVTLAGGLRFVNGALTFNSTTLLSLVTFAALLRAALPALACLLLLIRGGSLRFALAAATLLVLSPHIGQGGTLLYRERTFFGVNRVNSDGNGIWISLSHGTTVHGLQARWLDPTTRAQLPPPLLSNQERSDLLFRTNRTDEWLREHYNKLPLIPNTYYHTSGPIGEVFGMLDQQNRVGHVALLGMGAGTLSVYAQPTSTFIFYEIDPAVINIAFPVPGGTPPYFTYVADAVRTGAAIGVEPGDGRLRLAQTDQGPFDLIVLDAFSSDAIPVHLLTLDAVKVYISKLKPNGLIAFHISNRYFDLRPPLARIAQELNFQCYVRNDSVVTKAQGNEGKKESLWVVISPTEQAFLPLARLPNWERAPRITDFPLWTDDHANVLGALINQRDVGNK